MGYSVRQVIDTVRKVSGKEFAVKEEARRPGDPDALIADSTKAKTVLGWKPQYDNLETIVRPAWEWRQVHPNGYDDKA
jgi:UDP-glucose 4-epimerase